jgi:hypothetical protein
MPFMISRLFKLIIETMDDKPNYTTYIQLDLIKITANELARIMQPFRTQFVHGNPLVNY